METIITSDYKSLKLAYVEVKAFIEEVGTEVNSLQTKIDEDLGCAGDDNYELLEKFIERYNLDYAGFDYSTHFLSEGELFSSLNSLLTLIALPIAITFWLIKVITGGKVDFFKTTLLPNWQRPTLDLTFGDMLTWYLRGKYSLRSTLNLNWK